MKMVVVRNKDGSVSCLPVLSSRKQYLEKYDVVTFINKLWNYYHIDVVKSYYKKNK